MARVSIGLLAAVALSNAWANPSESIVAGYSDFPPSMYRTPEGVPAGLSVEVLQRAADRAGVRLRWHYLTHELDGGFREGSINIWPAAVFTEERRRTLHYTSPWWSADMRLLVRDDSHIRGPEDLDGKRIAVMTSPGALERARQALPTVHLMPIYGFTQSFEAACNGPAHGVFVETLRLERFLLNRSQACLSVRFRAVSVVDSKLPLAIVSDTKTAAIADRLRDAIDELALDGTIGEIASRNLPVPAQALQDVTMVARSKRQQDRRYAGYIALATVLVGTAVFCCRLRLNRQRRRQVQAALGASEASLARAQRIARLGSWTVVDPNTGLCSWSENARALCGAGPGELETREDWMKRVHADDRGVVHAALSKVAATGQPVETEYRVRRDDATERNIREHFAIDRDTGMLSGTVQDITEYRRLEQQFYQAQKLESVGRLAGGIAHDFNNLLAIINGYSELALAGMEPGHALEAPLTEIRNAGDRAAGLTKRLLAFSRRQVMDVKAINLNSIVSEMDRMLQRLIGEDVTLSVTLDPNLKTILADADQMHQVIMNLAVNARDAMPTGGTLYLRVENIDIDESYVAAHSGAVAGSYVLLSVTDTGTGMDSETQKRIFEPFFTTKERGKGTGLGLATVYGIVHQTAGWVWVYSEVGIGTTFKIYLPAIGSLPEQRSEVDEEPGRGSETVLVVEDQDDVRRMIATVLTQNGYTVREASDIEDALAVCDSNAASMDLVITDVVMRRSTGPDVAAQIRARSPETRVLFMSGYPEDLVSGQGVSAEVAFIPKPFSPKALLRKVREVLTAGTTV